MNYLKDYNISTIDYEYLLNNLDKDKKDLLELHSKNIKENLKYLNEVGIKNNLYLLILKRIDLILLPNETLKSYIKRIDLKLFIYLVNNDIDDLILFGV